jgi:hypothetical protein
MKTLEELAKAAMDGGTQEQKATEHKTTTEKAGHLRRNVSVSRSRWNYGDTYSSPEPERR